MSKLSDQINALPPELRSYVHDLETRCDPAGDVVTAHVERENAAGAAALLARYRRDSERLAFLLARPALMRAMMYKSLKDREAFLDTRMKKEGK